MVPFNDLFFLFCFVVQIVFSFQEMFKTALLQIFVIYFSKCLKFLCILSLRCFLLLFCIVVWNVSNVQEMFQILNNLSVKTSIPGLGFVSKYTLISTRFFLIQGMWTLDWNWNVFSLCACAFSLSNQKSFYISFCTVLNTHVTEIALMLH